ncbi:MAG: DNA translocase FtsK 4TM domain-containing protein [Holosporales bacterium]|jgi:S-DNA-T family DNA segregation ATPase FtsK/SpoIIIE|nr:DNA translocase FtsK 4TM domain-containing protein [Holosporales bacterium]
MRKRGAKNGMEAQAALGAFIGSIFCSASVFCLVALASYSPMDVSFWSFSVEMTGNVLGALGAYAASVLLQSVGLLSYPIVALLFVWGVGFMNGRIHRIKYRKTIFVLFVLLGCVIFNILSTYPLFEAIFRRLDHEYYAGGMVGYTLSKIVFMDLFGCDSVDSWVLFGMAMVWLVITKRALFVELGTISVWVSRLVQRIYSISTSRRKKEALRRADAVWSDVTLAKEIESLPMDDEHMDDPSGEQREISHLPSWEGATEQGGTGTYTLPSTSLLEHHAEKEYRLSDKQISETSGELLSVLSEFGINGEIVNAKQGPVVTMFELKPAPGIKTSRVISLSDDIARSMSALSARIATIPGRNVIGIELPNKRRQTVYLRELLASDEYQSMMTGVPLILGKDISGVPILADLAKMPHLLVAGTTGSGKSVSINAMILSILYKFSPRECKLIMIDPKMLELSVYDEIPHLLTPVVTDPKKAIFALKWAVAEMEHRYKQMSQLGVRNIDGFNKKLAESREKGDLLVRRVQTGFDQETGRPLFEIQQFEFEPMPYIVVIVDEMADLMLVAGKEVESAIQRLAQMARAAGIHLIMATQRPSVDVITGTIKANFPTRISFQVTSKIDSRTILGEQGAEQLLGQGDMLYMSGGGKILRIHGPFVTDREVERIVSYIKGQEEPNYANVVSELGMDGEMFQAASHVSESDDMYDKALEIVRNDKKCSISYIQRKLQIGYNRAARIVEEMEEKGAISSPNHTGRREILI